MIAVFNFLRDMRYTGLRWDSPQTYALGGFESAVHKHELNRTIRIATNIAGSEYAGQLSGVFTQGSQNIQAQPNDPQKISAELSKYWYLRASRTEIPRTMEIGVRGLSTPWGQPIDPDGSNVTTFLLERYTKRDRRWNDAENWLKQIVPEFSTLKTPMSGRFGSVETQLANTDVDINLSYQGTGTQKVLSTIAALVFSPEGSTIIIEEPEIHLHPRSQEVLVDLFNTAVTNWNKQVIITTHSWDMLLPFVSDIGQGTVRGRTHVKADASKFKLSTFSRDSNNDVNIQDYDLRGKDFPTLRSDFKTLWG
jgi:hypothetical protein